MSEFVFPDLNKTLNLVHKQQNIPTKDIVLKSLEIESKKVVKSQITIYLEDTLNYMEQSNLIPELPKIMNIKYINVSTKEILFNKLQNLFGKKSNIYNFPASTNIFDGTIYISNYFQQDFNKDYSIKKIREQFNNNIHQTIEYAFFHEIGHLFLIEKNKDKISKQENNLFSKLRINIEEGFAESFAIHMLCLKYPQIEFETNKFNKFQTSSDNLCKNMCEIFHMKKHDEVKKTIVQEIKDYIKKQPIKIEEMFNDYEFPLIYKNTPFKDSNGKLITDMNIIFEQCLNSSLENNKEVIKLKINNNFIQEFKNELMENLQIISKNPSNKIEDLITSFHNKVTSEGFIGEKITGLRILSFNTKNTQTIKNN